MTVYLQIPRILWPNSVWKCLSNLGPKQARNAWPESQLLDKALNGCLYLWVVRQQVVTDGSLTRKTQKIFSLFLVEVYLDKYMSKRQINENHRKNSSSTNNSSW